MTALRPPSAPTLTAVRTVDDDALRDFRRALQRAVSLTSLAMEAQSHGVRAETISLAVECAYEALRMMGHGGARHRPQTRVVGEEEVDEAAPSQR